MNGTVYAEGSMKVAISVWPAALAFVGLGCAAQLPLLEEACRLAQRQLSLVPNRSLEKSMTTFTDNGHSYSGCVVRLQGNRTRIKEVHYPGALFYPFEGSALYQQGWRADREADGPDGASFRISKEDVFCLVQGNWDGGDDTDPRYVPSTRYEVIVSCSYQE